MRAPMQTAMPVALDDDRQLRSLGDARSSAGTCRASWKETIDERRWSGGRCNARGKDGCHHRARRPAWAVRRAVLFAAQGASVVVADINLDAAEEVAAAIRRDGGQARSLCVDVSKATDVEAMIDLAESEFGGLDVLYNNAGLWLLSVDGYVEGETDAPSPRSTEDIWDRTVAVSMKGTYLGCRFGIPAMRRRVLGRSSTSPRSQRSASEAGPPMRTPPRKGGVGDVAQSGGRTRTGGHSRQLPHSRAD